MGRLSNGSVLCLSDEERQVSAVPPFVPGCLLILDLDVVGLVEALKFVGSDFDKYRIPKCLASDAVRYVV